MKRTVTLMIIALLLMPVTNWARSAKMHYTNQDDKAQPPQDPWTAEEYAAFYQASSAQDLASKEQFIAKYPQSALTPLVQRGLIFGYLQSQNLSKAFATADAYFASNHAHYVDAFKFAYGPIFEKAGASLPQKPPEDFDVLINLILAANGAARAKTTNVDQQAMRYIDWASALIKSGSVPPTLPPDKWKGNENLYAATLVQTQGLMKFNKVSFKVTDQTLSLLKAEGTSDDTLGKLANLKEKEFMSEESLAGALQSAVGAEAAIKLKPSVLKHAVNRQPYYESADLLRRAGELAPTDAVTFFLLGDAVRLGKYADARESVEQTKKQFNDLTGQLKQIEDQVAQINKELQTLNRQPDSQKKKDRVAELTQQGEQLNQRGTELSKQLDPLTEKNDKQVEQVNQVTDDLIRVYAKVAALTDNNANLLQLNKTARGHLERYYKYRHDNKLDGLQDLVQKMKTELP